MQNSVSYVGPVIDAMDIHPMKEALLNYYVKFISNLSTLIQPMTALLHKDAAWEWSQKCQSAKTSFQSDQLFCTF